MGEPVRNWALPVASAATLFLVLWAGVADSGKLTGSIEVVLSLTAAAITLLALGWRRRAPVAALAVVSTAEFLPATMLDRMLDSAGMTIGLGGVVALYSLAARRSLRATIIAALALLVMSVVEYVVSVRFGQGIDLDFDLSQLSILDLLVVFYGLFLTGALGRARWRWRNARQEAAARLARATAAQRHAAEAERHRLARELHDVSAHHLTAIVVTGAAAERLSADRPEMAEQALCFAAQHGRDTSSALERLTAVMDDTGTDTTMDADTDAPDRLCDLIDDLAAGMTHLGQRMTVHTDQEPPGLPLAVVTAAHAIARETLTNTVRYAPGAHVTVRVRHHPDSLDISIDDDGSSNPATSPAVPGTGRGITGMRERAEPIGGHLTATPRHGGGWSAHAALPLTSAGITPGAASALSTHTPPSGRWPSILRVDVLGLALIFAVVMIAMAADNLPVGTQWLLAALMVLRALPMLWRRRRPWTGRPGRSRRAAESTAGIHGSSPR